MNNIGGISNNKDGTLDGISQYLKTVGEFHTMKTGM